MFFFFAGKLVLDHLGIEVDRYYASEVDEDAIVVTMVNHGNRVTQLGDVSKLTNDKVRFMSLHDYNQHSRQRFPEVALNLEIDGSSCSNSLYIFYVFVLFFLTL